MAYATRPMFDADSHLMELPDWLETYADPEIRERLRPLQLGAAGKLAETAVKEAVGRAGDEAAAAALEEKLMSAKGWYALGAFDPAERSRALDLLGFEAQLVFSTFAARQFVGGDQDLLYGGLRAHNRAMNAFCADDDRMLPVAQAMWEDPDRMVAEAEWAIDDGAAAVMVPSLPAKGAKSPTHPVYDPLWRLLEERSVPFMLHIGGNGRPIRREFHDNDRPTTDFLGGGENIRSKDYMAMSQIPEQFLSALVLDGVFQRFPGLRGGCIELGALWVPAFLKRLDLASRVFAKTEPSVQELDGAGSEQIRGRVWFTPFAGEDVGWLIDSAGDDLFLFSSDYPHPEGGRDPVARFEETMPSVSDEGLERFYRDNFVAMMG